MLRAGSEVRGRNQTETEETDKEGTDRSQFRGMNLDSSSDSEQDEEREKKQHRLRRIQSTRSRQRSANVIVEQVDDDAFMDQVASVQAPRPRAVQKQQVTRNVRKIETDGIVSATVVGYDFVKRLYSVKLVMANAEDQTFNKCKMKLNWKKHMLRALEKVKRQASATAYSRFLIDVDHSFSFAPKYRSFREFVQGRFGRSNHRSILLVGTV